MNDGLFLVSGILCFAAIANIALGLLALVRNSKEGLHRRFFILTIGSSLWIITNLLYVVVPVDARLAVALASYGAAALAAIFFFLFCIDVVSWRKRRNLQILAGWFGAIVVVASMIPGVLAVGVTSDLRIVTNTVPLVIYGVIISAYMFTGIGILVEAQRHARAGEKNKITVILAGLSMAALFGLIFNFLLPLSGNYEYVRFGPLATLLFVGASAYAIIKHRLFDIRFVVARSVAYLFALLFVAFFYVLVIFAATNILFASTSTSVGESILYTGLAMVVALSFQPLKGYFDKQTDRIFFRNIYDPQEVLDELGDIVVREVALSALVRSSLRTLSDALKPTFIVLELMPTEKSPQRIFTTGSSTKELVEKAIDVMANEKGVVETDELSVRSPYYKPLHNAGIAWSIPLTTSRKEVGRILFGFKENGTLFNNRDHNLVMIAANQLAVAVQNAQRLEEIKIFNQTLEGRIAEATAELKRTNQKLHELDDAKDEFISMASHQLRTPLTSVKGYLSMVLEGDVGKLSPSQRKVLEEAYTSSQRMVYLIGDFLNVSRIQTGKFELERTQTNLAATLTDEIEQLRAMAQGRQLALNYEPPSHFPLAYVDADKFRQVMMNFIDNAIYYSHTNAAITISLTKEVNDIVFKVTDQGIGVPASERHKLFTKFYRATNAKKARPDGTGIGLFMAQKVIVAHGGSVIFESKENQGSTFGFRLPLKDNSK